MAKLAELGSASAPLQSDLLFSLAAHLFQPNFAGENLISHSLKPLIIKTTPGKKPIVQSKFHTHTVLY